MTATLTPPPAQPTAPPQPAPKRTPTPNVAGTSLLPTRKEWLDISFLGALIVIAVYGFGTAYGGSRYFIAGVVGTVLGLVTAHICNRTRQPLIVVTAAVVVIFFLFGGPVAVPDHAIGGVLPSIGSLTALTDGLIQGWAKLLTTLTPVGSAANLLTVPYVCGLLAGVISLTVARRTRRPVFAVLMPVLVLALSILFGTARPASLILQGAVFAGLTIGWVAIRHRTDRRVGVQSRTSRRWVGMVGMLLFAGLAAHLFGQAIPGAKSNNRVVLRDQTEPPFDPRDYPSPLNGYRKYTDPTLLQKKTLFKVSGLKAGDSFRLATLDSYDGVVYTVGNGPASSGYFQRVGETIPVDSTGAKKTVTVEVGEYNDVWVPSVGKIASIDFLSSRSADLQEAFRYNQLTGTAADQNLLKKGDRYRMNVVVPNVDAKALEKGMASPDHGPALAAIKQVQEKGEQFAGSAPSAMGRMKNIRDALVKNGAKSDGNKTAEETESRPGHFAERLAYMVDPNGVMVGNGEQYAPLAALMGASVGVPTRVVMGFRVPSDGDSVPITGNDVTAWVEVNVADVGWVAVDDVVPKNLKPQQLPEPERSPQSITPPPPPPPIPTSEEDETDPNKVQKDRRKKPSDQGFVIPAFVYYVGAGTLTPLLVIGSITGVIASLKLQRRKRRRTKGSATERIAGGWYEVTDLAADLGSPVPPLATRREAAGMIGNPASVALARSADGNIFGPGDPTDDRVAGYWDEVDSTRGALVSDRTKFEKWKALVNLSSLRTGAIRRRAQRRDDAALGRRSRGRRHIESAPVQTEPDRTFQSDGGTER